MRSKLQHASANDVRNDKIQNAGYSDTSRKPIVVESEIAQQEQSKRDGELFPEILVHFIRLFVCG